MFGRPPPGAFTHFEQGQEHRHTHPHILRTVTNIWQRATWSLPIHRPRSSPDLLLHKSTNSEQETCH